MYDSLDDDLFEGFIGVDDDDEPRALIEYTYVSSKYTSMINAADKLGRSVEQARKNQDRMKVERSQQSRKSQKATRMTNVS